MAQQPTLTASLTVKGGVDAVAFYQRAFDATVYAQKKDGKRLLFAVLGVFGGTIMVSDQLAKDAVTKAPPTLGGTTFSLYVDFDTPGKVDAMMKKAVAAGCTVAVPAEDTRWGMRYGCVLDPFGHAWAFTSGLSGKAKG